MRRFTLIGPALMAVLALVALPVPSASAVETLEILPSLNRERVWTGQQESESAELTGPLDVRCTAANSSGTQLPAAKALGLFHDELSGCESATKHCTGLNELVSGVILMLGTWHLFWDRVRSGPFELTAATVFLVEPLHFSCGGALLAEMKGELICLDLKATESNETHSFHCVPELKEGKPTNKQEEEWCEKDPCTTWNVPLLSLATNEGEFKESS